MNEYIIGPIIGALIAGVISLFITYTYWYFQDKLERQNIVSSFYFEIEELEKRLKILDEPYNNWPNESEMRKRDLRTSAILNKLKPIYPKTGFYYQYHPNIIRFNPELYKLLFDFYNNIIFADELTRVRAGNKLNAISCLEKAYKILKERRIFQLLELEGLKNINESRSYSKEILTGFNVFLVIFILFLFI